MIAQWISTFELRAIMQDGVGKALVPGEITIVLHETLGNRALVRELHDACMSQKLIEFEIAGEKAKVAVISTQRSAR